MDEGAILSRVYGEQWENIRRLTYDYLAVLKPEDLLLRLPFPESQTLGAQFRCMAGAHQSYIKKLRHGSWQGFASSLDEVAIVTPAVIVEHMQRDDASMRQLLAEVDLSAKLANGQWGYEVVQRMIEHEMHHHGQLINFLFCHHLPIPPSWHEQWNL